MKKIQEIILNILDVPFSLGAVVAVQLAVPIVSFTHYDEMISDIYSMNYYGLSVFISVFWLLPLATIIGIGLRSKYTFIIFILSAIANIYYFDAYLTGSHHVTSFVFLRWFFMTIIVIGGVIILRLDHLIPFLVKERRKFRRSPRTRIEKLIKLQIEEGIPDTALLKNISEGGLLVSWLRCAEHEISPTEDKINFNIQFNEKNYKLSGHIVWQTEKGDQNLMGFRVVESNEMKRLFYYCHHHLHSDGFVEMISNAYRTSSFRKLMISLWSIIATLSVIIPSCVRVPKHDIDSASNARPLAPQVSFDLQGALESSQISIDQCASGFETSFNSGSSSYIDLTVGDVGCLASLDSFTYNGRTFIPAPGYTFDTDEGHLTPFKDNSGSMVHILVTKQIPAIIDGPTSFGFMMIDAAMGNHLVFEGTSLSTVSMSIDKSTILEGSDTSFTVTVTRTLPYDSRLLVNLVHSGSAEQPSDFTGFLDSIYIEEGQASASFQVTVLDDMIGEESENIVAVIGTGPSYLASTDNHVVVFNDNDIVALPSDPSFHLNQDSYLASGGFISQWTDGSINALHGSQSAEISQPSTQDGYFHTKGVSFDGIDDFLILPNHSLINLSTTTDLTIAFSIKTSNDVTTPQVLWHQGGSSKGFLIIIDGGKVYGSAFSSSWNSQVSSDIPGDSYVNIKFVYSHTSGKVELHLNGVLVSNSTSTMSIGSHNGGCGLGGVSGATQWQGASLSEASFSGQIGEFIFFNRNLDQAEQEQVISYFNSEFPPNSSPSIGISSTESSVSEDGTSVVVTVERNLAASLNPATYNLSFAGTATMGADFESLPNTISFQSGELIKNIVIVPIDDTEEEASESMIITIDQVQGYTVLPGRVELNILDDDLYFLPTEELVMDFDSQNNITSVGSNVTLWENLVVGGVDWGQNTNSKQPFLLNTQEPIEIVFDGVDDQFQTVSDVQVNKSTFTQKTILLVIRTPSDILSTQTIYGQGAGTKGLNIHIADNQIHFVGWNTKNDDSGATTPWGPLAVSENIIANDLMYLIAEYEYSDAGKQELRISVNGQPPTTISGVGKLFSHSGGALAMLSSKLQFASNASPQMYSGSVLKMAYYNRILSTDEMTDLTTHLDGKYP